MLFWHGAFISFVLSQHLKSALGQWKQKKKLAVKDSFSVDSEPVGRLNPLHSLQALLQDKAWGYKPSLQASYLNNNLLLKHIHPWDASHLLCICYADDQQMLNKLDGAAHCAGNSTRNYRFWISYLLLSGARYHTMCPASRNYLCLCI